MLMFLNPIAVLINSNFVNDITTHIIPVNPVFHLTAIPLIGMHMVVDGISFIGFDC